MTSFPDLQQGTVRLSHMACAKWRTVHQHAVCMPGSRAQDIPVVPFLLLKCARPSHPPFQLEGVLGGSHVLQGSMLSSPSPLPFLSLPRVYRATIHPVAAKAAHRVWKDPVLLVLLLKVVGGYPALEGLHFIQDLAVPPAIGVPL